MVHFRRVSQHPLSLSRGGCPALAFVAFAWSALAADADYKNILVEGEISHRDLLTKKSVYEILHAELEDGTPRAMPDIVAADPAPPTPPASATG